MAGKKQDQVQVCCLDLEGVLIPEIWVNVAKKTKVKELLLTTRDEPNYDKLMRYRLDVLKKNKIKMKDITKVISTLKPLPGAKSFLKKLQAQYQVIILSDTFYEFAAPLMKQLDWPTLFCHSLEIGKTGYIKDYHLRQSNQKEKAVKALLKLNFTVRASGDSYNDITMLQAADKGILFQPPTNVIREYPQFKVTKTYAALLKEFSS